MAMGLQTQWLLTHKIQFTNLIWFILFSTLTLYALHRLTGLNKVQAFADKGRYSVISKFKSHIGIYALLGAIAGTWFFLQVEFQLQVHLVLTGFISLGYVLPVFGKGKRLRDIHYVKIFLIALTWSWVTVLLPALEAGESWSLSLWILVAERAVFIFAITLPFDIRDFQIDAHTGVKTIPGYIGMSATKKLVVVCLIIALMLGALNIGSIYNLYSFIGFSLAILLTAGLVWRADKVLHDYYYTGALDGSMVLQFLLVWLIGS
jgi:4-hydroxybenzoate polyprenyltransferase